MTGLDELAERRYNNIVTQLRNASSDVVESRIISDGLKEHLKVLIAICQERIDSDYMRYSLMTSQLPGEDSKPITEERLNEIVNSQGYPRLKSVLEKILNGNKHEEDLQVNDTLGSFDKLIDMEKIKTFQDISRVYLKPGNKETLKSLAGLLHALIEKEFFDLRLKPKLRNGRSKIRKAFEEQYQTNISEQFKPKLIDKVEVKIWLDRISNINSRSH